MSIRINGLDKLQRQLKEAQQAVKKLNGQITTLEFNADDPRAMQRAIRQMESAVDTRVSQYRNNPFVVEMVKATKEKFRKEIRDIAQRRVKESPFLKIKS